MDITLQPGEERTITQEGMFCYFKSGGGPVYIELRDVSGTVEISETIEPGQGIPAVNRFARVRIVNRHTATQTVTLFIYAVPLMDNRAVVTGEVKLQPRETFNGLPMMTTSGTIAANPARVQLELSTDQANAGVIWLGGVANSGLPMRPGGVYQVAFTGEMPVLFATPGDKLYIAELS